MDNITMNVSGMTCMGCVNSVKRVVQALPGVGQVDVSLETGAVAVQYDAAKVQTQSIKEAIDGAGFKVVS